MKIIRRPTHSSVTQGTALTIGNFDGVHLGHTALLQEVVQAAKAQGLLPGVVTLTPHPKEFFDPHFKLNRISTLRDRLNAMRLCGVQWVCLLPFEQKIASLSPEAFVTQVLVRQLQVKQLWVGNDFRFGAKRAGDFEQLEQLGKQHGFEVKNLPEVCMNGVRVSSSLVRTALLAGHIDQASALLGRPVVYTGHVIHGKKLGRTLGFPTLNVRIPGKASALTGVLAVWVHGLGTKPLAGVASLGVRPTVEQSEQILLETFIPNWSQNAYGKCVTIEVMSHLRPEIHFDDMQSLIKQMHQDTDLALRFLEHKPSRLSTQGACAPEHCDFK